MAMHRDVRPSNPAAWPQDFARDYERAFGHHPGTMGAGATARGAMPSAESGSIFDQMSAEMQSRLAEVESRHADALRDMQVKLERMSGDASRARATVPAELTTTFARIEHGMAQLADRMAEAGPERRRGADGFVFAAPKSEATHFVFNTKPHQPVAPVSIEPAGGRDPWDDEQAELLAQLYERGEAGFGQHHTQHLPDAAIFAHVQAQAAAVPPAPHIVGAGLGDDRVWLDARLSGLTDHVAKSIEAARPGAALSTLMDRVDQLETRFGTALGGLATKSDLEAMRGSAEPDLLPEVLLGLEAQIKDLAGHIETTHQQLSRLDAIEHHLSDLQAFAHASMDAEPTGGALAPSHGGPSVDDFSKLAEMAVERALSRMPAPVAHAAVDPAAGAARAETQSRIDAVHGLLNDFAAERRRGDQYTTGMLETVQEALIRLIDRVNSIEATKGPAAAGAPVVAAAMAAATVAVPAPVALEPQAAPPPRRREARRVEATAVDVDAATTEAAAPVAGDTAAATTAAQPEISIKDLKLKTRRIPVTPAPEAAAAVADVTAEPVAKAARKPRAAAPANSSAGKRGMVIAAMALGLVGVAYVASLMLADRYGAIVPASAPPSLLPKPAAMAPAVKPAAAQGQGAPAGMPPGMIGEPTRAVPRPAGAPADGPVLRLPPDREQRSQVPAAQRPATESIEDAMKPRKPSTIPETVNDDVSRIENDSPIGDALPAAAELLRNPAAAPRTVGNLKAMPGMSLDTSAMVARAPEGYAPQRQANVAAQSERLGGQARPASDFSGRFGATQPAPAMTAGAAAPAAAAIVTGSNPAVKPQLASTGAQPGTPQAPIETAVTDNVSETAEMPPAMVGPLSLRMAAAKGDPSAAFEVATRLAEGRGIKQDFKLAMTWYQRSANKGFAVAQYRLGTLYERGLGTPVDANRARVWYKRAADQGNIKAMHNMAVLSAGNGQTAPDYATAAKWFKDAADRGLADSQFNLGVLNESGLGIAKDSRAAYVWFSLAARSGDAEAARRRDLLLAALDAETLKSADEQIRAWRTRPSDVKVNDARVAGDQWRLQQQGQYEPAALPQPVSPPEPPNAGAAQMQQAAPAIVPRVIKAPAPVR